MTKRETMQALLSGERLAVTPQWWMAFFNMDLVQKLVPPELLYDEYPEYPPEGAHGFRAMGEVALEKEAAFNRHIDRCAFPVGRGANAAFGHSGPGEYNPAVIFRDAKRLILQYETGARKEIRLDQHFVRMFNLPVSDEMDLDSIVLPNPDDPARYAGIAEDIAWAKANGEWTIAWVNGFFSAIHYFFRDYASFFLDFYENPQGLTQLLSRSGEWTLAAARRLCEAGVDCIGFCDDLGSGTSMLISPDAYRAFIWPWHRRLCDLAHGYGVRVHMHSHGAIMPILSDIAKAGVDILNPLDPDEGLDFAAARQAVGPRMVLCGGLNKHFFDFSRQERREHLAQVIQNGREHGPHILMDSGGIPGNVTKDEFDWLLETSAGLRAGR